MFTIDQYCDAAIKARGFKSDRELSRALGFASNAVTHWRTKRAWPSDETMIELARLAEQDTTTALAALNAWRAPESVQPFYMKMVKRLAQTAAAIALAGSVATSPAAAAGKGINQHPFDLAPRVTAQATWAVYYGKLYTI